MTVTGAWLDDNRRGLMAELDNLRLRLEQAADGGPDQAGGQAADGPGGGPAVAGTALDSLTQRFGLSSFERAILLLCAGVELDEGLAPLCARVNGDAGRGYPTFGLALGTLPDPHWSALTPAGPLRRWKLVAVDPSATLVRGRLRIDERILHFLAGVQHLDERLAGLVTTVRARPAPALVPSHAALAARIAALWAAPGPALPVVSLCGVSAADRRQVAASACAQLDLHLWAIGTADIPTAPADREAFVRLWEREAALAGSALLVEFGDGGAEAGRADAGRELVERLRSPLITSSRDRLGDVARSTVALDVGKPSSDEQRGVWREVLGARGATLNGQVDALVSQFNLSTQTIANVATALARAATPEPADVWTTCRAQSRPRLDDLAQRIGPAATWDQLVLPAAQLSMLRQLAAQLRHRGTVYEAWGFAERTTRGLGITALFAGASGTGKTMAAEVLAGDLRLDLYRIDLSQVVSKYIGETEKNLRRVFDAADDGGAILLFDEADALFGKRSEVKDSHDRYANIEVSYLLQRMEAYRGLAILTTNAKGALDPAFLRRLRFVVQFPFPDLAQRGEIWRRIFPDATPVDGLEIDKLARLTVTGGHIANIAMNAAFLAAEAGTPVGMSHVLQATSTEYAKLEKPLSDAEVGNW